MSPLPSPTVYAVSDRRRLAPDARTLQDELIALDAWIDRLCAAGIDAVQVREPDLAAATLVALMRRVVARAAAGPTRILVSDRVDIAVATGAGVHLPASGLAPGQARALSAALLVGRSVHTDDPPQAAAACDYVLFGAVFATASKPGRPAAGLDALARFAAAAPCPVLAIGGVTPERAAALVAAGASGVAAIGAFLPEGIEQDALGPVEAVRAFREALTRKPRATSRKPRAHL